MAQKKVREHIVSHRLPALACLSVSKIIAPTPGLYHYSHRDRYRPRCGAIVIIFTDYKFARFVDENDSITPHYVCSCIQEHDKYTNKI